MAKGLGIFLILAVWLRIPGEVDGPQPSGEQLRDGEQALLETTRCVFFAGTLFGFPGNIAGLVTKDGGGSKPLGDKQAVN